MTVELWIAYVSTAFLLMITPGPSQLLMLSNTLGHGFKNSKFNFITTVHSRINLSHIRWTVLESVWYLF